MLYYLYSLVGFYAEVTGILETHPLVTRIERRKRNLLHLPCSHKLLRLILPCPVGEPEVAAGQAGAEAGANSSLPLRYRKLFVLAAVQRCSSLLQRHWALEAAEVGTTC